LRSAPRDRRQLDRRVRVGPLSYTALASSAVLYRYYLNACLGWRAARGGAADEVSLRMRMS
jgi:hypothetical protein